MQFKGIKVMKSSFIVSLVMIMVMAMAYTGTVSAKYIKLKSPSNQSKVIISNPLVQEYWDQYEKGAGVELSNSTEQCRPNPVTLKWTGSSTSAYKIYISTRSDFKNYKVYKTSENQYDLYNLYAGKKYYWKVQAVDKKGKSHIDKGSFKTKAGPRTIYVDGAYNTRDIGGVKTSSGKKLNQGLVYRSGNFDSITAAGKKTIKALGITTELDIRQSGEGKCPSKTIPVKKYKHIRGYEYTDMWESEAKMKKTVKLMKVFTKEKNYPIVYHCKSGRDRTSMVTFLLYGMLGVSKKNIYRDYELTFLSAHSGIQGAARLERFDQLYEKMSAYKDSSKSLKYNIRAFLKDYGMTKKEMKKIEAIMLQ